MPATFRCYFLDADNRMQAAEVIDAKALGQMHAKPQTVDIGAAAHNAIVSGDAACNVRQRVG